MAIHRGPNIVRDGLVFGYDADDRSSRFYPGEPTTNLTSDTVLMTGWGGSYTLQNSSTKTFYVTTIANGAPSTTSAWRSFYWSVSSYVGQYITISANVKFVQEINCTFSNFTIGQGNTGTYPYHIAGSDPADRVTISTRPILSTQMSWSGVINVTGIVGFCLWVGNATVGTANCTIEISNVQIEAKDHVTQFVNGTRSSTQSLINLKKTSTIDVSNLSFDATAHPYWNGTDVILTTFNYSSPTALTVESIFAITPNSTYQCAIHRGSDATVGASEFWLGLNASNQITGTIGARTGVSGTYNAGATAIIGISGVYYHVISTWDGSNVYTYVNGELKITYALPAYGNSGSNTVRFGASSNAGNNYPVTGNIPIAKIYWDKSFSIQEVRQNFNVYKSRFNI